MPNLFIFQEKLTKALKMMSKMDLFNSLSGQNIYTISLCCFRERSYLPAYLVIRTLGTSRNVRLGCWWFVGFPFKKRSLSVLSVD